MLGCPDYRLLPRANPLLLLRNLYHFGTPKPRGILVCITEHVRFELESNPDFRVVQFIYVNVHHLVAQHTNLERLNSTLNDLVNAFDIYLVDFCNCFTLSWAMTSVTTKNRPTSNRNFKAISSTRTMVNVWTEIQHCELVFGSVVTLPNPIKEGKQTNLTNTFLFSFTWLVVRSHQGCGVMTCRRTRCTCPNKEPSLMDHSC